MGIVRTLWKVVRRPMMSWWIRNGSWWLVGIVLAIIFKGTIISTLTTSNTYTQLNAFNLLAAFVSIIPLILFVIAATVCDGYIVQFYEQHAAPMREELLWGRYMLALTHCVPIALATIPTSIATDLLFYNGTSSNPYWISPDCITDFSRFAVIAIWLGLFIVLASIDPILKHGIALAFMVSELLNNLASSALRTQWNEFSFPIMLSHEEFLAIAFGAVPLWLLLAFTIKNRNFKLANVLNLVIIFSILGHLSIVKLYQELADGFLRGAMFVTKTVISPIYFFPQRSIIKGNLLREVIESREIFTWVETLIAWTVPAILLALIYLFVFSSYPGVWMEFLRKRLSPAR